MTSLIVLGIYFLVSYFYKQYKENNETISQNSKVKTKPKDKKEKVVNKKITSPIVEKKTQLIREKRKNIKDKEMEILTNYMDVSKEKIVQDVIFAEILSKPKSKR